MNAKSRALLFYWGPAILYMAAIFLGSSVSTVPQLPGGVTDKMLHVTEYALLGLLFARALAGPRWVSIPFAYVVAAVLLAVLYGASDELHQLFVPGRTADTHDLAADALGASASAGALWAWGIIRRNS